MVDLAVTLACVDVVVDMRDTHARWTGCRHARPRENSSSPEECGRKAFASGSFDAVPPAVGRSRSSRARDADDRRGSSTRMCLTSIDIRRRVSSSGGLFTARVHSRAQCDEMAYAVAFVSVGDLRAGSDVRRVRVRGNRRDHAGSHLVSKVMDGASPQVAGGARPARPRCPVTIVSPARLAGRPRVVDPARCSWQVGFGRR